jgi:hypothetical protein
VIPANVVQRLGLPEAVADGTAQVECPLSVGESLLGATLVLQYRTEGHVAIRLADLVAKLLGQAQGLPHVGVGFVVAAEPWTDAAEGEVGMGLPTPVTAPTCGGQRSVLAGSPLVPIPPLLEEVPQRPRKLPGLSSLPSGVGQPDRR